MDDLIKILESFNRKERFFLIAQALGQERDDKPAFTLSEKFRRELGGKMEVCIPKDPEKVFVGMDYHLDWVVASLTRWKDGKDREFPNDAPGIKGTQEDIDLLVAFQENQVFHLVFLEAKAYSGWTNNQMEPKAKRLGEIFDDCEKKWPNVNPHFFAIGPKESTALNLAAFPDWMKPIEWLTLALPSERRIVTRRGKEGNSYRKFEIKMVPRESI